MITEIGDGIFSAPHSIAEGKNAIIFGRRWAMAVDSGLHQSEGEAIAAFIRERGYYPDRLVLTHCHNDHILGGKAFENAEVFAHANAPAVIRRHLINFARFWNITEHETAVRVLRPTVLFSGELTIDLGELPVRLLYTPGHSEDHISAYIETQQLLIAGDVVVNSIIPAFMDGDSRVLEATLGNLLTLPIKRLLPGHGSLIDGAENVRAALQWTIDYLSGVRECVRRVQASGFGKQAALESADYKRLVGNRLPQEKMQQRHNNSVSKIFDEEAAAHSARVG